MAAFCQAWFYRCEADGTGSTIQVNTRDYMGSVGKVYMTETYAAVMSEGCAAPPTPQKSK
jgi:hypothetical protein